MAVLCEETACLVMKMYNKYCCQEMCCMFNDSACISSSFFGDFVIYVQVNLKSFWDTHLGSFRLFIALCLWYCRNMDTLYRLWFIEKPFLCWNQLNVSCKFDNMLQNFCVFDNRLQFKKPFIILGYLTIVTFIILFFVEK